MVNVPSQAVLVEAIRIPMVQNYVITAVINTEIIGNET